MGAQVRRVVERLFPAYAGVILSGGRCDMVNASFPRLRGGDPVAAGRRLSAAHFSPPTRG